MIYFDEQKQTFILRTKDTCYAFGIVHGKYLCHYYYGEAGASESFGGLPEKTSFTTSPCGYEETGFSLETLPTEYSYYGTGDFRTTSLRLRCGNDENTMFFYDGFEITDSHDKKDGLPRARGKCETLCVSLSDEVFGCRLYLYYKVFYDSNVITRYSRIVNEGSGEITVENCMSLCLDLYGSGYDILSLYGSYGNEMQLKRNPLFYGNQRLVSRRGATGHACNPFFAVCDRTADYDSGGVYGFNLVYSGSFLSEAEVTSQSPVGEPYDMLRIQTGICSENFGYTLAAGEEFASPEAIMTFSECGINGMTRNMHAFVNEHILYESKRKKPIVLNTWEACYFDICDTKLVALAKRCPTLGIDTLVVDDGWFGWRNNEKSSLGDWFVNEKKFSGGLKAFTEQIAKYVRFGIWIEPEMISKDSVLYREHPDWVFGSAVRPLSTGRYQYVLDLTKGEVSDYLKRTFKDVLSELPVSYIKWDMNRHLTEVASKTFVRDTSGAVAHRYLLAVYDLLNWFRETFPDIYIETCSGGGGRYDLGIAYYSDAIWTSDNTFPDKRLQIQTGALTAYPSNMMSCHISCPTQKCEQPDELERRFVVAAQGVLGYELNLCKISLRSAEAIKKQTERYVIFRDVIMEGVYRILRAPQSDGSGVLCYSKEDRHVLFFVVGDNDFIQTVKVADVDLQAVYKEYFTGKLISGCELAEGYIPNGFVAARTAAIEYFIKQ